MRVERWKHRRAIGQDRLCQLKNGDELRVFVLLVGGATMPTAFQGPVGPGEVRCIKNVPVTMPECGV